MTPETEDAPATLKNGTAKHGTVHEHLERVHDSLAKKIERLDRPTDRLLMFVEKSGFSFVIVALACAALVYLGYRLGAG